jgi:hypothetical protein
LSTNNPHISVNIFKTNPYINNLFQEQNSSSEAHIHSTGQEMLLELDVSLLRLQDFTNIAYPENKNKLLGLSPQANYTDRATADCQRS